MQGTQGDSLNALINGKPLRLEQLLTIGTHLADELGAIHARGSVHGRVAPSNIVVSSAGQARLVDSPAAVPNYQSPEQVRGESVDARTDLFSLGLVLYEMATGRQAFRGATPEALTEEILTREPIPAREVTPAVPKEVEEFIARALEKDRAKRHQTAGDMLAEMARLRQTLAEETASTATAVPVEKRKTSGLLLAIPALVILGIAAYFFWRSSQPPDFKEHDSLVIADFDNTTGEPVFDDSIRQAISIQFQQSPYVTLVADQSVQRQLRVLSRSPEDPLVNATAREVCQRSTAKASVEGSIARRGSGYVLDIEIFNCKTGASLATERAQGGTKEELLTAVGPAVLALRRDLGEPRAFLDKYNVPVAQSATGSIEALKAYAQGIKTRQTRGDHASVRFFEDAIRLDPEFALAHARLGVVYSNLGRAGDASTSTQKAYALRDRLTEYERLYITWSYAQRATNDMALARSTMEAMTKSYPRDFTARNNLGVQLMGEGLFQEALAQYLAAHEIAPDEPLPVSNSAYALMFLGRHNEAYTMIDRALALRPDSGLAITRWLMARMQGHPRAEEFEATARTVSTATQILFSESTLAIWEGRLEDYSAIVERLRARVRDTPDAAALEGLDASEVITLAVVQGGPWVQRLNALARKQLPAIGLAQVASALAITGQMDTLRALAPLLDMADLNDPQQAQPLTVARALLAASNGQVQQAEAIVDSYLATHPRALDLHYYVGMIREQSGRTDDAIASYRRAVDSVNILGPSTAVMSAKLSLALLLKNKGDTAGAKVLFDELLKQWANADADFEPLKRVKANL